MSQTFQVPFTLRNGDAGTAMIVAIPLPNGRTLVTCANLDQDGDAPVNMAVEYLFKEVSKQLRLDPALVVWIEYGTETLDIPAGRVGGWELVTWKDRPGHSPIWRQMADDDWRGLGTVPPPSPWGQQNNL